MLRRIILTSRRPSQLSLISPFSSKKDPFDVGHHPVHPISTGDIRSDDEFTKEVVKAEEKRLMERMKEIEGEIRRILDASNEKLSSESVKKLVKLAAEEADKEASRAVKPEIKPHFL